MLNALFDGVEPQAGAQRDGRLAGRCVRWASVALLSLGAAAAQADTVTSSASSAASSTSASLGSLSDSVEGSSKSSGGGDKRAQAGTYRLVQIDESATRPGQVGLRLQGLDAHGAARELRVWVPQQVLAVAGVAVGQQVEVSARDYGLAFALRADAARPAAPFFLALDEATRRDLRTTAVPI
jgi:hypothetical protein